MTTSCLALIASDISTRTQARDVISRKSEKHL
jgi:hypothetical protein